jgi:hypothetical protein
LRIIEPPMKRKALQVRQAARSLAKHGPVDRGSRTGEAAFDLVRSFACHREPRCHHHCFIVASSPSIPSRGCLMTHSGDTLQACLDLEGT